MKRRDFLALLSASAANALIPATPLAQRPIDAAATVAPASSGDPSKFLRFIAFGDSGTGDDDQCDLGLTMAAYHQKNPYDLALMLGDNIYPDGNLADVRAKFERPYEELLGRGVKFQAVLGNHDVRKGREKQINYHGFNMGGRPYRSFTGGNGLAEFFALDSNNFDLQQRQWLESALAASQAKWKIVYFHHPIYSSAGAHGSNRRLRAEIEPLLVRHRVSAVFSGHDHTYERTKPQNGVQYFVSGAGGKLRRGDLNRRNPFFASGNDETCSFMAVDLTPERFGFTTIDVAGRVIDSGELLARPAAQVAAPGR
jgi:acid phosphatase